MNNSHGNLIFGVHILGLVLVFGVKAFGQTSQELSCKAQAKEVALQTYQSCVTDARKDQIDSLRKEYSAKLSELKEHYNNELRKAAGKEAIKEAAKDSSKEISDESNSEEGTIQLKPSKKPGKTSQNLKAKKVSKSLARVLPKKQSVTTAALPVSNITEDMKVVAAEENGIETAASQIEAETSQGAE